MKTISYKLKDLNQKEKKVTLKLGYVGENEHVQIRIDCSEIWENYPNAVASLAVEPPEGSKYPAIVTREGNVVCWTVKDSDVAHDGDGRIQLTFTEGSEIQKTVICRTKVDESIIGSGTAPDPIADFVAEANEALAELEAAEVHGPVIGEDGYWYTWSKDAGEYVKTDTKAQGEDGQQGPAGKDGKDGKDGADGAPGQDGHTPVKGTDYWTQQDQADIVAAAALETVSAVIDDAAGDGDTNKTWSADKISETTGQLLTAIDGKLDSSAIDNTGITEKTFTVIKDTTVTTVDDGEHENPYATISGGSLDGQYAYRVTFDGVEYICHVGGWYEMVSGELKGYECLGDINLYNSSITGLIYNENDKPFCILYNNVVFDGFQILTPDAGNHSVKIERINYTKENIPNTLLWGRDNSPIRFFKYGSSSYLCINILGMNTFANRGEIAIGSANELSGEFARIFGHGNKASGNQATVIGSGNNATGRNAVVIGFKNKATEESASAIGNQCIASGVVAVSIGDQNEASGSAALATGYKTKATGYAASAENGGTEASGYFAKSTGYKTKASGGCSCANGQETIANHNAQFVFGKYNVADPSNAAATNDGNFVEIGGIGTGTNARKNCRAVDFNGNHFIKGDMYVKCNDDSTGGTKLEPVIVEEVTGSTPSITGEANHRYICGECSTLSIVAPASGIIDVLFESGSTATVLTVTSAKQGVSAVKWANGFDLTNLDANKVYELNIMDGEYGVVCEWT